MTNNNKITIKKMTVIEPYLITAKELSKYISMPSSEILKKTRQGVFPCYLLLGNSRPYYYKLGEIKNIVEYGLKKVY